MSRSVNTATSPISHACKILLQNSQLHLVSVSLWMLLSIRLLTISLVVVLQVRRDRACSFGGFKFERGALGIYRGSPRSSQWRCPSRETPLSLLPVLAATSFKTTDLSLLYRGKAWSLNELELIRWMKSVKTVRTGLLSMTNPERMWTKHIDPSLLQHYGALQRVSTLSAIRLKLSTFS